MNTYLLNYIKRDNWLSNGQNFGLYLRERDKLVHEGTPHKKANKIVKKYLWKAVKKAV